MSVVILTCNSEATIADTVSAASRVSDDIHVVDSFSSDRTCALAEERGVRVCKHKFVNYAAQRNWAINTLPLKYQWELHLDADERLSDELIRELDALTDRGVRPGINGYLMPRLVRFLGRDIRHGGMFPTWHLRLFRRGKGRCENREYDQHFLVDGGTGRLHGPLIDDFRMTLSEWIARHNRWSDAEVRELLRAGRFTGEIEPRLFGSPIERKRYLRALYYRSPLFLRTLGLFLYRYVLRRGFLDGKEGAIYFALQAFWYRFLVDAKLYERSLLNRNERLECSVVKACGANPAVVAVGTDVVTDIQRPRKVARPDAEGRRCVGANSQRRDSAGDRVAG